MKTKYAIALFVLACTVGEAQNLGSAFQITPYFNLHGYTWKEFDDNGAEALKESGPKFAFGVVPRYSFLQKKNLFVEMDMQFTFGSVDYQGFKFDLQTGQRTAFTTTTGYTNFELATNAGYIIELSRTFHLTPIAGFGYEVWNREIAIGDASGYDELYSVLHGNIGGTGTYVASSSFQFFFGFMLKIPFSISETIDKFPRGQPQQTNLSISPGVNPRFAFHIGGSVYRVFAMIDFETWTLSRSPDLQGGLHQPESTRMHFGIKLGYTIGVI
jgi:hypothetical protein